MARLSGNEDLYADLASPIPSTSGGILTNVPEEIWLDDDDENTRAASEEDMLKNTEMNLYAELLESDIDRRKEKTQVTSDYVDLQREVLHLKALVAEKDSKISALTQQDANVRKNICSLYKTAKAEIDHKDSLLTEANKKLDTLLYRRNLTLDQLEKQMPQTSSEKHNDNSKSNEDKSAGKENPKKSNAKADVLNKSHSGDNKKKVEQLPTKRKRSCSPPSDNKNAKVEKNSFSDKKQNCDLNNSCNTPQPVIKDNLNKKQSCGTNSGENPTTIINTENSDPNNSHNLSTGQNLSDIGNTEHLNKKPNSDLNSGHSSSQTYEMDQEPSIEEVFLQMQELAFKDPEATNAVFFNMLPSDLSQSFLEFEKTQADALNKLKQSFISSYFRQCNSPEENSVNNSASQNSLPFFFQQNSLHSKTENTDGLSASNTHCESVIEPRGNVWGLNEVKTESEVQKSGSSHSDLVIQPQGTVNEKSEVKKSDNSHSDLVVKPQGIVSEKSEVKKSDNSHSDLEINPQGTVSELNERKTKSDVKKSGNSHSDSVIKSQGTVSKLNEVKTKSDVRKSGKKPPSRHKRKKEDVLSLHKNRDEGLTLYTQRHIGRHKN